MKKKELKTLLPLNLQFFAEDDNPDDKGSAEDNNQGGNDDSGKDDQTDSGKKTFTQEEVTRMMTREKKEGRNAAIKALGFENEEEAKKAASLLKALLDSQKSDKEKAEEEKNNAVNQKSDAEKRASEAEAKLTCFLSGVNKDSIDDVLSIALPKVTEDKDLSKVLEDMKKNNRYASFFEGNSGGKGGDKGTGNPPGHSGKEGEDEKGSYGKRLGSQNKPTKEKKSSYF